MITEGKGNDRLLICCQCGSTFSFTSGEQKFYSQRNLIWPKRCPQCREERRRHGTYGSQVVAVDSVSGLVLCRRCSRPASREVSMRGFEAVCRACHDKMPDMPTTPQDDLLLYEEWEEHFKARKEIGKNGEENVGL